MKKNEKKKIVEAEEEVEAEGAREIVEAEERGRMSIGAEVSPG